jgi:hypothetical protein
MRDDPTIAVLPALAALKVGNSSLSMHSISYATN